MREVSLLSAIRSVVDTGMMEESGGYSMESKKVRKTIYGYAMCGRELAKGVDIERRKRLSYRLLSNIRFGCVEDFYDGIMKLYIDKGFSIPQILIGLLNRQDEIQFEDKAYAFMSGFLGSTNEHELDEKIETEM